MDGGRGFFSSTPSSGAPPGVGATRARPVSAGTRLRQKPANAAAHQDFFASLGIDSSSRDRTGSSASTSSNRSYNSMTMRPASASGPGSTTSLSSGWRPPPIGGLGRQSAPPPPMPTVGSLNVAGIHKSVTNTSSTSGSGLETPSVAVTGAVKTSETAGSKPTQLFSMEDTEDLYSDDGWNCDSPSTVLSNPTEEAEAKATAASETPNDEFAWGDDDDAFTSPVAKTTPTQPPPYEMPPTISAFETKVENTMSPPPQTADVPSSTFITNEFEVKNATSTHVTQQTTSTFEHEIQSTVLPPPAGMAPTTEVAHSMFEAKSYSTTQMPHLEARSSLDHDSTQAVPAVEASISDESHQQDQWDDDWDKHKEPVVETESTTISTTSFTAKTSTIQTETFVTPPVELTSPGGAAGEFWGDGDEDELFDHDDHADEEWDESIKDQTRSVQNMALSSSSEMRHVESAASVFSSQGAAFSLPAQPPSAVEASTKQDEFVSMIQEPMSAFNCSSPGQSEETKIASHEAKIPDGTQDTGPPLGPSPLTPPKVQKSPVQLYPAENTNEAKPDKLFDTEFSTAIAESSSQGSDPNVFPEAPSSAHFPHTPTGTGGPFPSNDNTSYQAEFTSAASTEHDAQPITHNSMLLPGDERGEGQESTTDSSVRWDASSLHSGGHLQMPSEEQANSHSDEPQHNAPQGQSDEEERDSVVSFSGENSFYPSVGRPSSLYGGSQSSFASHRVYQSSIASTDHDGSSIASFGVSSAGATFGGSERVSEGGAFSDGTVSETPSMVDSSNASTAFGTDFPSVSEGQFSAPGTTIGGSDNASDGSFSDDNASETTSMCESVNTNSRFVSEFSISSGHYVTETVKRDVQEPFASSKPQPDSATAFGESVPTTAESILGGDDSSTDANPFASSPSAFPPSHHLSNVPPVAASTNPSFDHQAEGATQEENIQSAASLFGATAGADVPNPFSSFGALSGTAAAEPKPIEEHELPTSDAGDLFGSGPSNAFGSPFAQQTQHSYSSSHQTHGQNYNNAEHEGYSGNHTSAFSSAQSQFASSSPFDRPATTASSSSPFESQSSISYNSADPFASRAQHTFNDSAPSADSVFSRGTNRSTTTSQFYGSGQASADSVFGGNSRSDNSATITAGHFRQQSNASYGGNPSYSQYAQSASTADSDQGSMSASDHYKQHPTLSGSAYSHSPGNTSRGQSYGQSSGVAPGTSTMNTTMSVGSHLRALLLAVLLSVKPVDLAGKIAMAIKGQFLERQTATASNLQSQRLLAPAHLNHRMDSHYDTQPITTPGTPDNYSQHSAAGVFGSASPAQRSKSGHQDYSYSQYGQNPSHGPSGAFGGHTRSLSNASTDAFFGRSSVATGGDTSSEFGGDRVTTPSSSATHHQVPLKSHDQPSFSRSMSNASSYADQHGAHMSASAAQLRNLNGSVDNASLSRHGSSSSMSRYGHEESISSRPSVDANSFFGGTHSTTAGGTASSFFGSTVTEDLSETQAQQFTSPPQQEQVQQQQYSRANPSHPESSGDYFGANNATAVEEIGTTDIDPGTFPPATPSEQPEPSNFGELVSRSADVNVNAGGSVIDTTEEAPPFANEHDPNQLQAFDGFADSGSQGFGGQASSDFFSSSPAPERHAVAAISKHQFDQTGYNHEQQQQGQQMHDASFQFAETHTSYQRTNSGASASYREKEIGAHSSSYFDSYVPGPNTSSASNFPQHKTQQQQQPYHQFHRQQQQSSLHGGYRDGMGQTQSQSTGYNSVRQHEYVTAGHGYGSINSQQTSHLDAASVMKTSNKYKDPCVAPPSCLASFGFGGNVVTMFPKRKLRLNIAGSGYRNSPRGAAPPSAFDNGGNGELRKGPVNVYHMNQLHPNEKDFEQMDIFPGPLTEDVSDEAILEYLDDRLSRSDTPTNATEVEDENARLLLGVLRVLVKCNGKLRSDPGTLNPGDPDSPEAQLTALLSESSKRRSGDQPPTFPDFEQMDIFPGPLTEDVSDEAILEYLDDRLSRSDTPTNATEVEDENARLLLGVLRVLVKCNGKLRSDPGTLNPGDPDSPEAQLTALLSESSKRRSGDQPPTFPAPRKAQSVTHPDLMIKQANDLRELLLVGDRMGAICTAMTAHMWPEAMLIASFTDKEEYRRVLRTYLDETYATGDPCRALFMSFADQQEKSVQEPKRLLQTNAQQPTDSIILSRWVSHAQVLLANRTADTNKILTELGDRLWNEANAISAAHVCYLLAGLQVEAPMPSSKMALLGGDHRTPTEARFYVSPGAVQRTEIYEWAQKHSKGVSANLMIPFQGYKLIYAMLLADHGKLDTAFKYVTSMLTVIKAVTSTMKPGTSMYLEGMKTQLTVFDDRLRQHLGQDRVASVAASTSRGGGRKQGKWGLGSALSIMGKIVNRVVEGNDSGSATPNGPSASTPGGLYANEATPPAASYPSATSATAPTSSPAPTYPQHPAHQTPPPSSHGPSPVPGGSYGHATPPVSQGSAPGSSNGYNRSTATPPPGPYLRSGANIIPPSGPFSGNGRHGPQLQQLSGPFSGNGRPGGSGPLSTG
ncbi:Hypothetical protein PHPALM_17052, partial [Phytophthora palmivora]